MRFLLSEQVKLCLKGAVTSVRKGAIHEQRTAVLERTLHPNNNEPVCAVRQVNFYATQVHHFLAIAPAHVDRELNETGAPIDKATLRLSDIHRRKK
jgi:hypothetical protein